MRCDRFQNRMDGDEMTIDTCRKRYGVCSVTWNRTVRGVPAGATCRCSTGPMATPVSVFLYRCCYKNGEPLSIVPHSTN